MQFPRPTPDCLRSVPVLGEDPPIAAITERPYRAFLSMKQARLIVNSFLDMVLVDRLLDRLLPSTKSITRMTEELPHGNNRRFEDAIKAYMLPNNRQELERMKSQHEWIKGSFGGLIKAPIDYEKKHQRILDSAAADGSFVLSVYNPLLIRLRDMDVRCSYALPVSNRNSRIRYRVSLNELKQRQQIRTDVTNDRPDLYPPSNLLPAGVLLVPGDLSKDLPAEWTLNFDLVHQRFMFPGFSSETVKEYLGRLMGCVKPGGWIQLVEPIANENVSGPDPTAFIVLHKLADICMKCPNPKDVILSKLKEGGFVNVNIQTLDIVVGKFQDNKELSVRGRKAMRAAMHNMSAMTK